MPLGILNNLDLVNRSHFLASGLVSWHIALPHYSSTQKWPDAGLAQNTGLFTAATWATSTRPGGFGSCVKFNGTTAFVAASSISLPVGSGAPISVAFWCLSSNLTGFRTPYLYGGLTAARGLLFAQDGGTNDGTVDVGIVGSNFISSTKKLVVNTWTHLCLTYDGTTAKLYWNGVLDSSAAATINPPGGGNYNLGTYDQASQFWQGSLDDIRTYWRPLSGTEVKELYDNSAQGCPGLLNFVQPELLSIVPALAVATPTWIPEVRLGPPFQSPWRKIFVPPQPVVPLQPAPTVSPPTAPEVKQGPPLRGAPWFKNFPPPIHIQAPAPPPVAQIYAPEVKSGPPMKGAPWLPVIPAPAAPALAPVVVVPQTYAGEVHGGPPLLGAPWFRLPLAPSTNPGGIPPAPPPLPARGHGVTLIRRDPTLGNDPVRRSVDILTVMINSLVAQGYIVQTGPSAWKLAGTSSGLTGTFTSGSV